MGAEWHTKIYLGEPVNPDLTDEQRDKEQVRHEKEHERKLQRAFNYAYCHECLIVIEITGKVTRKNPIASHDREVEWVTHVKNLLTKIQFPNARLIAVYSDKNYKRDMRYYRNGDEMEVVKVTPG